MADDEKKGKKDKKKDEPVDTRTYEQKITDLSKESLAQFTKLSKDLDQVINNGRKTKDDEVDKYIDRSLWEYR